MNAQVEAARELIEGHIAGGGKVSYAKVPNSIFVTNRTGRAQLWYPGDNDHAGIDRVRQILATQARRDRRRRAAK
jgi:hypothetical protein